MDDLSEILKRAPDDQELADYLHKKSDTIVSDWAYAAGTSNHAKMSSTTILLVRLLEACHGPELQSHGMKLIGLILKDHLRVIYRSLFVARPRISAPALNLLTGICKFPLGSGAADLYNAFDFSLKIIPKLLSEPDLRKSFISFYLAFIEKSPSAVRKDLMAQRKIISAWFSRIDSDSEVLVLETLRVLKQFVVRDRTFTKSAKLGLFNDWVLKHFVKLLNRADVGASVSDFLYYILTNTEHGMGFSDRGCYGEANNKLSLSLLRMIKPWESQSQMDLAVNLMKSQTELVAPYFTSLQATFSFTPKASMFWFSFAILHSRVMCFPLPNFDALHAPLPEAVAVNVLPSTLTKSALTAGLTSTESALIRFQTAQLILYSLRKLRALLDVYAERVWDSTQILRDVVERLPEIHLFLKPASPALVQTTMLACLREYSSIVNPATVLPSALTSVLDKENVSGLELINAHDILEVQAFMTGQAKWWNRANDTMSFFTKLIKFASYNPDLAGQCAKLLQSLVKPTHAFQAVTFASPIDTLLYSLEVVLPRIGSDEQQKLWAFIDESISRSVRTPFPYMDKFEANISPFAVALVEQWKHVDKTTTTENMQVWLSSYIRDLGIIGEDAKAVRSLLKELGDVPLTLPLDDYLEFVISAPEDVVAARSDIIFKVSTPLEFMATVHRAASSPTLAGHLLANLPRNLLHYLTTPVCFKLLLKDELHDLYISTLRANELSSPELVEKLEKSSFWPAALDFLSDRFLIDEFTKSSDAKIVDVLTARGVPLPLDLALKNTQFAQNLRLQNLDQATASQLFKKLVADKASPDSISAVIEASGFYESTLPSDPNILLAASRFAREYISDSEVPTFINTALTKLETEPEVILKLLTTWKDRLDSAQLAALDQYLGETKDCLNEDIASFADLIEGNGVQTWLKRCVLHLTRVFAKAKESSSVRPFVYAFSDYLARRKVSVWKDVNSNSLNALITTILSSQVSADLVLLTCQLVFAVEGGNYNLSHTEHLQTLLECSIPKNTEEYDLVCVLLWRLYGVNPASNSTSQIQDGILCLYDGSSLGASQLLLQVLREIESQQGSSWVDKVTSWELRGEELVDDYEIPPLVTNSGNTLQVTLEKSKIVSTTENFDPSSTLATVSWSSNFQTVKDILSKHNVEHPSFGYHDEFLISALASCDYIIKDEKLDVRILAESGCLAFIVCCLASSNKGVVYTATQLLSLTSITLGGEEKVFREQAAAQLLVNKVLFFLQSHDTLPGHLAVLVSQMLEIVIKPGHFLHEAASNWLLLGPSIKDYDLPLFKEIQNSTSEAKPRELLWLVNAYKFAMIDRDVVNIYIKNGVIEWLLTQAAQLTPKAFQLQRAIKSFLEKAEEVGGSMSLIGRHSALLWPAPDAKLVNSTPKERLGKWLGLSTS